MREKHDCQFDEMGRLMLPRKAVWRLGLHPGSKLLVTVNRKQNCIVMRPTNEEPEELKATKTRKEHQEQMRRKPAEQWRYIRRVDTLRQVVLPWSMWDLLHWTEDTSLKISWDHDAVYVSVDTMGDGRAIHFVPEDKQDGIE